VHGLCAASAAAAKTKRRNLEIAAGGASGVWLASLSARLGAHRIAPRGSLLAAAQQREESCEAAENGNRSGGGICGARENEETRRASAFLWCILCMWRPSAYIEGCFCVLSS